MVRILKQDRKHIKNYKERYLLGQHTCDFFMIFLIYQATKQLLNNS